MANLVALQCYVDSVLELSKDRGRESAGPVKPYCGHQARLRAHARMHPGNMGAVPLSGVTQKSNRATNQIDKMTPKARAFQCLRNQLENIGVRQNRRQTTQ